LKTISDLLLLPNLLRLERVTNEGIRTTKEEEKEMSTKEKRPREEEDVYDDARDAVEIPAGPDRSRLGRDRPPNQVNMKHSIGCT
jgi:hypothetical protein